MNKPRGQNKLVCSYSNSSNPCSIAFTQVHLASVQLSTVSKTLHIKCENHVLYLILKWLSRNRTFVTKIPEVEASSPFFCFFRSSIYSLQFLFQCPGFWQKNKLHPFRALPSWQVVDWAWSLAWSHHPWRQPSSLPFPFPRSFWAIRTIAGALFMDASTALSIICSSEIDFSIPLILKFMTNLLGILGA